MTHHSLLTAHYLFYLCLLVSIYYLGAIVFLYKGLKRNKPSGPPQGLSFSVVIAAHNEEKPLPGCLETILAQTVPPDRFEVIVVNDRSSDRTGRIVEDYSSRFANVKLVSVRETPRGVAPKKYAVTQGIDAAQNEIVVFTDADCVVPSTWLDTIDRNFSPDTALVQGMTTYEPQAGMNRLLYGFQAIDFLSHGVVAAAAIGAGMPLNSNANNLAFRKTIFESLGGYGIHGKVVSGDDDLLLQRVWRSGKGKVRYMIDVAGAVTTLPTPTLKAVFEQRKRWGSKTVHYSKGQVAFLSGIFAYYLTIVLIFLLCFIKARLWCIFAGMAAVKIGGEMVLMIPGMRLFDRHDLKGFIIPASLVQLPMVLLAVIFGVFGRFSWKDQKFSRLIGENPEQKVV